MLKGFECMLGEVDFSKCAVCDKKYKECEYPPEILAGMNAVQEDRGESISVTSLLGCLRCIYLGRKEEFYAPPEDLYATFRGSIAHYVVQKHSLPDCVVEKRFFKTIGGIKITGKPDLIVPSIGLLRDYKTCKEVPRSYKGGSQPYTNHNQQLQLYRWLVAEEFEIKKLDVVYMDMSQFKTCEVKRIWTDDEVEEFLLPRATVLRNAFQKGMIPKVHEEYPTYWQCGGYCSVSKQCSKLWQEGK